MGFPMSGIKHLQIYWYQNFVKFEEVSDKENLEMAFNQAYISYTKSKKKSHTVIFIDTKN